MEENNTVFSSGVVRLAFIALEKPKKQPSKETLKYEVTALIPKDNIEELNKFKRAAVAAIKAKWGADRSKWPPNLQAIDMRTFLSVTGKDGWPFRDGDYQVDTKSGKPYDGFPGHVSIKISNERKVGVFNRDRSEVFDFSEFYSGMYAQVIGVAYAWDNSGNRGVSFSLAGVRKVKDGEPFTRRTDPSMFDELDDDQNYSDPADF
jgi:hypothetical protein